eukprot:2126029-Amphidinium_carterae.3
MGAGEQGRYRTAEHQSQMGRSRNAIKICVGSFPDLCSDTAVRRDENFTFFGHEPEQRGIAQDASGTRLYDVSRAHFNSKVRRKVFMAPPPEDLSIKTGGAVLARAVYGLRDAAQCFDAFCEAVMSSMGCVIGMMVPCIYHHPERHVLVRYVQPPYASDDDAYIEWEPDPRHVEILRKTVGLEREGVKKLSSLGVRHGTDGELAVKIPESQRTVSGAL